MWKKLNSLIQRVDVWNEIVTNICYLIAFHSYSGLRNSAFCIRKKEKKCLYWMEITFQLASNATIHFYFPNAAQMGGRCRHYQHFFLPQIAQRWSAHACPIAHQLPIESISFVSNWLEKRIPAWIGIRCGPMNANGSPTRTYRMHTYLQRGWSILLKCSFLSVDSSSEWSHIKEKTILAPMIEKKDNLSTRHCEWGKKINEKDSER